MSSVARCVIGCGAAAVVWSAAAARAERLEFNFKDPKGVNATQFILDSPLEPIMGLAAGVGGKVTFDAANPKAMSGRITIASKSIHIENRNMQQKAHSAPWLDVKGYPEISFKIREVVSARQRDDGVHDLTVVGDFTCKGHTKELTVRIKATYLPGKLGRRLRGQNGDLLVLRSSFTIKRSDFDINPSIGGDSVADDVQIRVSIVGSCPR